MCVTIVFVGVLYLALSFPLVGSHHVMFNDPELMKIRDSWIKGIQKNPDPVIQCDEAYQNAALRLYAGYTSPLTQETEVLSLHSSYVRMDDVITMGLLETVAAMSFGNIHTLLLWEHLRVNSMTYVDPDTAKAVTVHSYQSDAYEMAKEILDKETGRKLHLKSCIPFPKWVKETFKEYAPTMVKIETDMTNNSTRNLFVKYTGGIGGILPEPNRFSGLPFFIQAYNRQLVYKTLMAPGTIPPEATEANQLIPDIGQQESAQGCDVEVMGLPTNTASRRVDVSTTIVSTLLFFIIMNFF